MHNIVNNLITIQDILKSKITDLKKINIIAVSKTFPMTAILPLINHGQIHFGENKIQEALEKWQDVKDDFKHIKLHMIGKLQTNKVRFAVPLFDYIHSLDSFKLAQKISKEQIKFKKKLKIFIQVNIGNEDQKNGIEIENVEIFYNKCVKELGLNIVGLMCLPPNNNDTKKYFITMEKIAKTIGVKELSMGMSNDFLEAAESGATFLRIGSKIFGKRI